MHLTGLGPSHSSEDSQPQSDPRQHKTAICHVSCKEHDERKMITVAGRVSRASIVPCVQADRQACLAIDVGSRAIDAMLF